MKDLEVEKIAGDEMTVLLLCKYLQHNISIMFPFYTWSMCPSLPKDIILSFDEWFSPTQDLSQSAGAQSKSDDLLKSRVV